MATNGSQQIKYLHIVSVFPVLTETFILREARKMREMGCEVIIGQLRQPWRTPQTEFEDLRPCVVRARLLSLTMLLSLLFCILKKPRVTTTYVKLVLGSCRDIISLLKLTYILMVSMGLAYKLRHSGILHVHGHHLHSEAVSTMFIAGFLGVPYSFKCYTVKTYYPGPVLVEVVRNAAFAIADTLQVQHFLGSLGADPHRVHVIRNAVSMREFPMKDRQPASEPPVILAVGRLDYKKGFHVLLSACSILRDEGLHFRCVIVGDGDEWDNLLARRKTLELEKQVEMTGSLGFTDVQQWYDRATLLVVPSVVAPDGSTDGLPTVIVEALARGVPVVGTPTAGIPEIIRNGVNGFIVSADSPRELARRMKELLLDQHLCGKYAAEGRRTAERYFDLDRNAWMFSELMLGQTSRRANGLTPIAKAPAALEQTRSLG